MGSTRPRPGRVYAHIFAALQVAVSTADKNSCTFEVLASNRLVVRDQTGSCEGSASGWVGIVLRDLVVDSVSIVTTFVWISLMLFILSLVV